MKIKKVLPVRFGRAVAIAALATLVGFSLFQLQATASAVSPQIGCGGNCSNSQPCAGECGCYFYPDGTARCIDALK